jgi:RNA polymerase sigma-70 factor (ECF subfamily)
MPDPQDLAQLIGRIRGGDQRAAEELFQRYGNVFLRTIRVRLENPSLRRLVDSDDIRQTVFKSLFVRLRLGQYDITNDRDLVNLLFKMAHHKLTAKQRRARRAPGAELDSQAAESRPSPSQVLSEQDLLREVLRRLSAEERRILELRDEGASWEAVAAELGGTPEARRKQWERARERVVEALVPEGEE